MICARGVNELTPYNRPTRPAIVERR